MGESAERPAGGQGLGIPGSTVLLYLEHSKTMMRRSVAAGRYLVETVEPEIEASNNLNLSLARCNGFGPVPGGDENRTVAFRKM